MTERVEPGTAAQWERDWAVKTSQPGNNTDTIQNTQCTMGKLEGVPATLAFHNGNEGKIIEIFCLILKPGSLDYCNRLYKLLAHLSYIAFINLITCTNIKMLGNFLKHDIEKWGHHGWLLLTGCRHVMCCNKISCIPQISTQDTLKTTNSAQHILWLGCYTGH